MSCIQNTELAIEGSRSTEQADNKSITTASKSHRLLNFFFMIFLNLTILLLYLHLAQWQFLPLFWQGLINVHFPLVT